MAKHIALSLKSTCPVVLFILVPEFLLPCYFEGQGLGDSAPRVSGSALWILSAQQSPLFRQLQFQPPLPLASQAEVAVSAHSWAKFMGALIKHG